MSSRTSWQTRKPIIGWLLYDIASSSYILLIPSIAYAVYHRQIVCGGAQICDAQWGMLTALALVLAGGLSPLIGAIADLGHLRHRFFVATTAMCCGGTALLYWTQPGAVVLGGLAFLVAQVGYILAASLYDSYLPNLVPPQRLGQLSSWGWGLGYLGGVVCFLLVQPWLSQGLAPANLPLYRFTFLIVAGFYGLVALPAIAWLPRQTSPVAAAQSSALTRQAYQQVKTTLGGWREMPDVFQFLLGYYLISDGVVTIASFIGIYLSTQFGLSMQEILQLTLLFNAIAMPATIAAGYLRERWSALAVLKVILGIWIATLLLMAWGTFTLAPVLIACCLGLVIGSTQAICRGLFAELVSPEQSAELFGFHALVSKVSAIAGPLLFGFISSATGNQRLAILSLIPFFLLGGWVLLRVTRFDSKPAPHTF